MVTFLSISYKNFLSTGNVPNRIDLNKYSATLITGKNGEGKSTILCAITYVLFGKPFRNINKAQLINSINQKHLLVEIEFEVAGKNYVVKRGMKPNIFQIFCDDKLLNEEYDTRDYQKILEQQILKLNYKTFTQVVILGSATFVPFMQLSSSKRREVIEDILDIRVFSSMNNILKEKFAKLKDDMVEISNDIDSTKSKIEAQNRLISALQESKDIIANSIKSKIDDNDSTIAISSNAVMDHQQKNLELMKVKDRYSNVPFAIQQADSMRIKFNTILSAHKKDEEFFYQNDICSKCNQNIDEEYKNNVLDKIKTNIDQQEKKLAELSNVYDKLNTQLQKLSDIDAEISRNNAIITSHNHTISLLNESNNKLRQELIESNSQCGSVIEETEKLTDLNKQYEKEFKVKNSLLEKKQLYDIAFTLLKDTGIKTAIIHEYMPVINKLINKYLTSMDFYAQFELDETFQEVIRSRNRDIFSYNSFSEGEKQKINLSILFAWRQIAKMKNSVNTNLLIMDEVFDGSIDGDSLELLSDIIKEFTKSSNTNVFVISHRDIGNSDVFDHTIRIEKRNEFSVIA